MSRSRHRCREKGCRKPAGSRKLDCSMHSMRKWRASNPLRAQYTRLRNKSKLRGIEFTITFEDFKKFALKCDYVNRVGCGLKDLQVDRIDNLRGYEKGNIQPLTFAKNREKQFKSDEIRMQKGMSWRKR